MSALLIALSLLAQDPAPAAAQATPPAVAAPVEDRRPVGAPRDDYPFVGWCYGTLRAYLELHDQVMPEVTRIETTFRKPGTRLSDDLKVYADMQTDGQAKLKIFQRAMLAAERASLKPINALGAEAVRKGRSTWTAGPQVTKARLAQEWMSWALPDRCETVAVALQERATLMGATFQVNAEPEPAPAAPTNP
ncbi:hypothetical protein [Phenylobacterium sp.]|uniref:hypothetical protein n=1 Tax=Phenylobacterium sp. TaxID=1871053 RepID=UPI003983D384